MNYKKNPYDYAFNTIFTIFSHIVLQRFGKTSDCESFIEG